MKYISKSEGCEGLINIAIFHLPKEDRADWIKTNMNKANTLRRYMGLPSYVVPIWDRETRSGFWSAMSAVQASIC